MHLIYFLLFFILLFIGIYTGYVSLKKSKLIFLSGSPKGFREVFLNSIRFGISITLIMFGGTYMLSALFEPSRQYTFKDLILVALLFTIAGVVAFLGSLWQYIIVGKFRDWMLRKIKDVNKK